MRARLHGIRSICGGSGLMNPYADGGEWMMHVLASPSWMTTTVSDFRKASRCGFPCIHTKENAWGSG